MASKGYTVFGILVVFNIFVAIQILGESGIAGPRAPQAPRPKVTTPGGGRCGSFPETDNSFYDLFLKLASNTKEKTIHGFLGELNDPIFLYGQSAKALMYRSHSRHGSSFQNPRALIMYGPGDLVVTFNGEPGQDLYGSLEVMGFNKKAGKFEFREILFKSDTQIAMEAKAKLSTAVAANSSVTPGATDKSTPPMAAQKGNSSQGDSDYVCENDVVKIRAPNTSSCIECHGANGKPIWDTYLAWQGAYGSFEETHAMKNPRYVTTSQKLELTKLLEFQMKSVTMERYGRFQWGNAMNEDLKISSSLFGIWLNYKMANVALRQALQKLSEPQFQHLKYAFAGYMMSCSQSFLPMDLEADMKTETSARMSTRLNYEIGLRKNIRKDLVESGDDLQWKSNYRVKSLPPYVSLDRSLVSQKQTSDPSMALAMASALTTNVGSNFSHARIEKIFEAMKIHPEFLTMDGKTSWDGYNEIPDYMKDYFHRFYKLKIKTLENREFADRTLNQPPRNDLDAPLQEQEYGDIKEKLEALNLPPIGDGGVSQLCKELDILNKQLSEKK